MNAHLLPPHLRAWQGLGLTHVLGAPQAEAQAEVHPQPHPAQQARTTPPPSSPSPPARVPPPQPSPNPQAPPPVSTGWPSPWDAYLERVRADARVVWTYFELAQDYAHPDDARRRLWAGLIRELKWKVGFWPVSELRRGQLLGRSDLFWRGVEQLKVPLVVSFGRRAHEVLFPGREYGFRRGTCGPARIMTLPGPAELLTQPQALAFARSSLAKLASEMGQTLGQAE